MKVKTKEVPPKDSNSCQIAGGKKGTKEGKQDLKDEVKDGRLMQSTQGWIMTLYVNHSG